MRRLRPRALPVALSLIAAVALSLLVAPGVRGLFGAALAALMIAICVSDARRFIIPDGLVAATLLLAFLYEGVMRFDAGLQPLADSFVRAAATSLTFFFVMIGFRLARGRDGIGLGDVKLAAVAGAWLDWFTILGVIEGAALTAVAAYLIAGLTRRRRFSAQHLIPFGAFLAPAIWIGWLVESVIG